MIAIKTVVMTAPAAPTKKSTPLVEIFWDGVIIRVQPAGPNIGQREAPIITQDVEPFIRQAGKDLKFFVLDLTSVQFMSSMGLGMCINWRNASSAQGAVAVLYGLNKELRNLLAMMKIDKLYKIAGSSHELRDICGVK
ncbi:MAG: anti-sigma factor antagonist [Phycisphaerales bacterium]|nr:anti-sigma factor antagonist [Phycisphaerales bacterium]